MNCRTLRSSSATSPSITTVLAWADLAGNRLDEVVSTEVYRAKTPGDFSVQTLGRLLDTDNIVTIAKVSALPKDDMNTLLKLSRVNLNALTNEFNPGQLQTIAWYSGALAQEPFNALVTRLLERSSRLSKFEPQAIRNAVANSREPLTAVTFLGNEPSFGILGVDLIQGLGEDVTTVSSGTVSGSLLLANTGLGSLLLVGLVVALVVVGAALFAVNVFRWLTRRRKRRRI